mgnify:CR=1 FL=1
MTQIVDYLGIRINLDREQELSEQAMALLRDYYMLDNELYAQQAFARSAIAYCEADIDFAQRIYDYASKSHGYLLKEVAWAGTGLLYAL